MADSVATLPSTSSFSSNLITAEIRVENLASSSVDSSASNTTATISVMPTTTPTSQQASQIESSSEVDNNNSSMPKQNYDEPEAKKQKLDTSISNKKPKKLEKLESRLGSVLCCAVCLDLPKTAMYQVSTLFSFNKFLSTNLTYFFLLRINSFYCHESLFFC